MRPTPPRNFERLTRIIGGCTAGRRGSRAHPAAPRGSVDQPTPAIYWTAAIGYRRQDISLDRAAGPGEFATLRDALVTTAIMVQEVSAEPVEVPDKPCVLKPPI